MNCYSVRHNNLWLHYGLAKTRDDSEINAVESTGEKPYIKKKKEFKSGLLVLPLPCAYFSLPFPSEQSGTLQKSEIRVRGI
eukprot:m.104236 g.104236  ORF g.104236 m.104236 type:complete len:81 (-) comp9107_c0_seq3:1153-1395(-)